MAYMPIKDDGERLMKWLAASGITVPERCQSVTIRWAVDSPAVVDLRVLPESLPDEPIPIDGAIVHEVTTLGDTVREYEATSEASNVRL
jgi:hypothetical protein